jgi:tRNA (guanine10-N2)-dimethyltransferase
MELIFELSKQNLELSMFEVKRLMNPRNATLLENYFLAEIKNDFQNIKKNYERLAYTKKASQILSSINNDEFLKTINKLDWENIIDLDFAVRKFDYSQNNSLSEKELADTIWKQIKNPKVNLKNPKTLIEFYFFDEKVIISKQIYKNQNNYLERMPHKRPDFLPISLNPCLARCMVNLSGVQKGVILDPCCGTGGILIEAGLMNLKPIGFDIIPKMIDITKKSLELFGVINYELIVKDALKLEEKYDFIVSDLPYAKNTKKIDLDEFYFAFFKMLNICLGKSAVLTIPTNFDFEGLLVEQNNLRIEGNFEYYIHKSLSKRILVIDSVN